MVSAGALNLFGILAEWKWITIMRLYYLFFSSSLMRIFIWGTYGTNKSNDLTIMVVLWVPYSSAEHKKSHADVYIRIFLN